MKTATQDTNRNPTEVRLADDEYIIEYLKSRHPEWVTADGDCVKCVSFVHELAENITGLAGRIFRR